MPGLSILAAVLAQPGAAPGAPPFAGGDAAGGGEGAGNAEFLPPALTLASVMPSFGAAKPGGSWRAAPQAALQVSAAASLAPLPQVADDPQPSQVSQTSRPLPSVADQPNQSAGPHPPPVLAVATSPPPLASLSAMRDASIDDPLPAPAFGRAKNVFEGDFLILAAGAMAGPNFEGSKQTVAIPAAGVAGRLFGIGISPRAAGIALNFVPSKPGAKVSFSLGPVIRYRSNRSGTIKDPVVASLGKLRGVLESGFNLGLTVRKVFNRHDQLSAGVDLRWDILGRGGGGVVAPSVSYLTPLSRAQVVGLLVSAEVGNKRFADYNYSVSPAGSAASGLPVYSARRGLKSVSAGIFTARDLDGNLLNGGFAVAVGAIYSRLKGSAAESPITRLRGKRSQWMVGGGLAYVI